MNDEDSNNVPRAHNSNEIDKTLLKICKQIILELVKRELIKNKQQIGLRTLSYPSHKKRLVKKSLICLTTQN